MSWLLIKAMSGDRDPETPPADDDDALVLSMSILPVTATEDTDPDESGDGPGDEPDAKADAQADEEVDAEAEETASEDDSAENQDSVKDGDTGMGKEAGAGKDSVATLKRWPRVKPGTASLRFDAP